MKRVALSLVSAALLCSCGGASADSSIASSPKASSSVSSNGGVIQGSHVLVAYFSVTNHTRTLAGYAMEHLDSDLFEIVPVDPYTDADIDYNSDCRANDEQNDPSARPKIRSSVPDISVYDTVVLGYPIWWGQAPKIMYTFLESYDFSGKTILPFCTSGSSPIGTSATNLSERAPEANWLNGKRFASNATKEEIGSWLDEMLKEDNEMKLTIDEKEMNVVWEENASVDALKSLAKDGLTIAMHEYGGFEQTGAIGQSIISNDERMDVVPGDIVLYQGNQISVFYNPSAWSYTRLGHIEKSQGELNELLNKDSVTFVLSL